MTQAQKEVLRTLDVLNYEYEIVRSYHSQSTYDEPIEIRIKVLHLRKFGWSRVHFERILEHTRRLIGMDIPERLHFDIGKEITEEYPDNLELYRILLPSKFDFIYKDLNLRYKTDGKKSYDESVELYRGEKTPEISVGKLVSYNDGTFTYDNQDIEIRAQLKDLLRLFMKKENELLTKEDIVTAIIDSKKRKTISPKTIAKYVHEVRKVLRNFYGKDVIFSHQKEGWIFKG